MSLATAAISRSSWQSTLRLEDNANDEEDGGENSVESDFSAHRVFLFGRQSYVARHGRELARSAYDEEDGGENRSNLRIAYSTAILAKDVCGHVLLS